MARNQALNTGIARMKDTTVIFDLGNVIVLYDENIVAHRFAEAFGLDKSFLYQTKPLLEQITKEFDEGKISPETLTKRFSSVLNVPLDIEQFKTMWCEIFTVNAPVMDIAKQLKGKARLLILSNTNVWHFEYIRENLHVLEPFDDFVLSYQLGYGKPDRRIFERAIELSRACDQIIYFDDILEYVTAAREVGICAYQYVDAGELYHVLNDKGLL